MVEKKKRKKDLGLPKGFSFLKEKNRMRGGNGRRGFLMLEGNFFLNSWWKGAHCRCSSSQNFQIFLLWPSIHLFISTIKLKVIHISHDTKI